MLRILRNYVEAHRVVLILQGYIVAEWAGVLERECRELSRSGFRVSLDLTRVVFVGRPGIEALGRLGQAGVGIMGCPPLLAEMLENEGIEVGRTVVDVSDGKAPWKPGGGADA